MILTKPQAEAVYSAMVALRNVDATLHTQIVTTGGLLHRVYETATRSVRVLSDTRGDAWKAAETYDSQDAFATAYGIPDTCSECGGSGEVETGIGMLACTHCPAVTKQMRAAGMSPAFAAPYTEVQLRPEDDGLGWLPDRIN